MIKLTYRAMNLCSILLGYTSCDAFAHDGDHREHTISATEEACSVAADLATIARVLPDPFLDRDGSDPDNVLRFVCADDEPAIPTWAAASLDYLCAEYTVRQVDLRTFVVLSRGELRQPVAIGYSLGRSDAIVVPVPIVGR